MKNTKYDELLIPYREELLSNLKKFIAIDSVYDEESVDDNNPFGKGVSLALNFIYELAKKDGFEVVNYNNMVVEIITGSGDKNITILAHADVVPEGDGWEQDPFEMIDIDGVLTGRGVADDKGPLLASYYALKMLKDNNLLGDYKEAGLGYCRAIELEPMAFDAHYNLAILLKRLGKLRESQEELEKAMLIVNTQQNPFIAKYIFDIYSVVVEKSTIQEGAKSKRAISPESNVAEGKKTPHVVTEQIENEE